MKNKEFRTVLMSDRKEFLSTKEYLCNIKADFVYESAGSIDKIYYDKRCFVSVDLKDSGGRGHHLSKLFMADIDTWLEKNKTPPQWDNNYREQMFNLDAIESDVGRQLVMVDINDCYWRTALLLGYITEETYIKGLKSKSWKLGRNACIGSLAKTTISVPFKKGVADRRNRRIIHPKLEYQLIRNHIIGHVYNIFNDLFKQMGDTFYMFLTDCLVTRYSRLRDVQKHLRNEGYRSKAKPLEFLGVDRNERKIMWHDFQSSNIDQFDRDIKAGKDKYYLYSDAQIIQSSLVSSINHFNR